MENEKDFEIVNFHLKEGVTNFTESDVRYYRSIKGFSDDAVIIVTRPDGTQDWY